MTAAELSAMRFCFLLIGFSVGSAIQSTERSGELTYLNYEGIVAPWSFFPARSTG